MILQGGCRFVDEVLWMCLFFNVPMTDPWDDCIYTYMNGLFVCLNVGKYISPMDHMGYGVDINLSL